MCSAWERDEVAVPDAKRIRGLLLLEERPRWELPLLRLPF